MGCKDDQNNIITTTASINVVHAAIDAGSVKVNPGAASNFTWAKSGQVGYSSNIYTLTLPGSRTITVVNGADTTKTWISKQVEVQAVNTLYLAGQAPVVEGIFVAENNLPYITPYGTDNSAYIRFVNLSPNSPALNINIQGTVSNEVTALTYKGISAFKKYVTAPSIPGYGTTPAVPATPNYLFEIRDASTNALLFTYTLNAVNNRFKTITLVIKGLVTNPATTGTNAFGLFQVNNAG